MLRLIGGRGGPVPNLALTATITASSELVDRPASFLNNSERWKKWRSDTDTVAQWVKADLGSSKAMTAFGLVDFAGFSGEDIIIETSPDNSNWTPRGTFTQPAFNPRKVSSIWIASVSARYVRVTFENDGMASGYAELGVLVVGTYYQPTYNALNGFRFVPVDPSEHVDSLDGQRQTQERTMYRRFEGTFPAGLSETDRSTIEQLWEGLGTRDPLIVAMDPDDMTRQLYGRLEEFEAAHDHYDKSAAHLVAVEAR